MSSNELIICNSCKERVSVGKFCTKCGAILGDNRADELNDDLIDIKNINDLTNQLRTTISDKLTIEAEKSLLQARESLQKTIKQLQSKKELLTKPRQEKVTIPQGMTMCFTCGNIVPDVRFCKDCGSRLYKTLLNEVEVQIEDIAALIRVVTEFKSQIEQYASENENNLCDKIISSLQHINMKYVNRRNILSKEIPKTTPKTVQQKPKSSEVILEKPRIDLRAERNLLNYWVYYLAIILLSIGIALTIYYITDRVPSVGNQLAIIYSIGGIFVITGLIITIITKISQMKKEEILVNDQIAYQTDEDKKQQTFPHIATPLLFIGFIVLFVSNIIGIGGDISKITFIIISLMIAIIAIGIGIFKNSEILILMGLLQAILYVAIDLLWIHYPSVLSGIGSLFVFSFIIISATTISIFFKKWWGTLITITLIPIFLAIPRVFTQVSIEVIPLALIPIAIALIVRFSGEHISSQNKNGLVVLSFITPMITLLLLSIPSSELPSESPWEAFYPFELVILIIIFLGVGYYYRYIEREYLGIQRLKNVHWIIALILTGLISIINVSLSIIDGYNFLSGALFFILFFIFAVLQTLKFMQKYSSIAGMILSLSTAVIHSIFILSLSQPSNTSQEVLYFLLMIAIPVLTIVFAIVPKIFIHPNVIFPIWVVISGLNITLLGLMQRINHWYGFIGLLLFLTLIILTNLPFIVKEYQYWRTRSIVASSFGFVILFLFLATGNLIAFSFEAVILFGIFILANLPVFFIGKQKEVMTLE